MIEVFRTDVQDKYLAASLITALSRHFPACRINFDLEDCDRILRIEGECFTAEKVKMVVNEQGFMCEVLV